ncbi:MAG: hypothetical protein WCD16_07460 [Paracoccaceae bacterium]|jgi:hypothetical protein
MIVIAGVIAGALWGGYLAKRRNGKGFDIAQYAAGYAIAFGLVATILTIALARLG